MLDLKNLAKAPIMTPSLGWLGIQAPGFATDPVSLDNPTTNWFYPIHIFTIGFQKAFKFVSPVFMFLEQLSCYAAKQQRLCVKETLAPSPLATPQHRGAAAEWVQGGWRSRWCLLGTVTRFYVSLQPSMDTGTRSQDYFLWASFSP